MYDWYLFGIMLQGMNDFQNESEYIKCNKETIRLFTYYTAKFNTYVAGIDFIHPKCKAFCAPKCTSKVNRDITVTQNGNLVHNFGPKDNNSKSRDGSIFGIGLKLDTENIDINLPIVIHAKISFLR